MINLFNYTDEQISDMVNGTQIVIPPNSHTFTSERKANEMCNRYRGKIGLQPKPDYTQEEYNQVKNLKKPDLVAFAQRLMSGERPDPNNLQGKSGQGEQATEESEETNADVQA